MARAEAVIPVREVSLREMLEAMAHMRDDETFRWYQTSKIQPDRGWHECKDTLRVTVGQARRELGIQTKGETDG